MKEGNLVVYLKSWDEKSIKIAFSGVIQFCYKLGYIPEGIYEKDEGGEFLKEALSLCYEKVPENHSYKLYEIRDQDDFPFFQIVGEKVSVQK